MNSGRLDGLDGREHMTGRTRGWSADAAELGRRFAITDDMTPDVMRPVLREEVGRDSFDRALMLMSTDVGAQEQAALAFLSFGWHENNDVATVQAALAGARGKLPVVNVGLVALSVINALYLLTTKGLKKRVRTVEHRPDGTFV